MRRVSLPALKEGMKVGRNVYSAGGQMLLAAGQRLTSRTIARLAELGFTGIYVEDELAPDVAPADMISEDTRAQATRLVASILEHGHKPSGEGKVLAAEAIRAVVARIVGELLQQPRIMVDLSDIRSHDDYTFSHSVNVAVLALVTGMALGYPYSTLHNLGTGALLHDIGKMDIPLQILNKPRPLTAEEYEFVKRHAAFGAEIVAGRGDFGTTVTNIVLQHHERYGGQGYPGGLKHKDISPFAAVTSIADTYDAMTADRVYRRAHQPHEAYEFLAGSGNHLFDFNLVRHFLHHVAAYPTGTVVELSDRTVAVVTGNQPGQGTRPRVRVLWDGLGMLLRPPREVDLAGETTLTVTRALAEDEIAGLPKP
ncbi:MAG: HD-GYP domain-containing protein [Clostridia bacterium]|nr:MAG: HD-GYP domain-containing protein [Clostridia bacterium]